MQETLVQSLGWEDPLEKEMPTHSSIIAWRIPWTEKPTRLSPWDRKQLDTIEQLTHFLGLFVPMHRPVIGCEMPLERGWDHGQGSSG